MKLYAKINSNLRRNAVDEVLLDSVYILFIASSYSVNLF